MQYSEDLSKSLPRNVNVKPSSRTLSDIKRIVIHTTDDETTILALAKYDINPNHISDTGCPTITYNDVILKSGQVFHTLEYTTVSWHVGPWNPGSVAVSLMYQCTDKNGNDAFGPSDLMLKTCYDHCADLCLYLRLTPDNIVGHRELSGTGFNIFKGSKVLRKTCPGLKVDLDLMRVEVAKRMQKKLKDKGLYQGDIDGSFGPGSKVALSKYV